MEKRGFLRAAAVAGGALPVLAQAASSTAMASSPAAQAGTGPALLTVTGGVGKVNRGRFDPALDQMMHKQKITFERAYTFDFAALQRLPAVSIKPTLEYDGKVHQLSGPALLDVLHATGATPRDDTALLLRAVDGYAVALTVAQAKAQRFIVATHIDGKPLPLGGLGPLWAVYDADRDAAMAAKPVDQRFGQCPWALYHIDIPV